MEFDETESDGAYPQGSVPRGNGAHALTDKLYPTCGVVMATYVLDDTSPTLTDPLRPLVRTVVFCDLLTYSSRPGMRVGYLPRVRVAQPPGSGMQRGRAWKPRATKRTISGAPLDPSKPLNPMDLDGDHVLIDFIDGASNQPIITAAIEHPHVDVGNEDRAAGHRLQLKLADGDPDFIKHHGAFYGVSDGGDFVVDLTRAHGGTYDEAGREPRSSSEPPERGANVLAEDGTGGGNLPIRLRKGANLRVEIDGVVVLELTNGKATLRADAIELAGGGEVTDAMVLGDKLKAFLSALTVPTAFGPSGPPLNIATVDTVLSTTEKVR